MNESLSRLYEIYKRSDLIDITHQQRYDELIEAWNIIVKMYNDSYSIKGLLESYRYAVEMYNQTFEQTMAVYKFSCECWKTWTSTMYNSRTKCPGCGSKKHMYKTMIMDENGNKIKNQIKTKYDPIIEDTEAQIKEKIRILENQVKSKSKKVKEAKMEQKMYIVKCVDPKCMFEYETNNPHLNKNMNACQNCKSMNLQISEKKPTKKISRFTR